MKKLVLLSIVSFFTINSSQIHAWSQPIHKRIVIDALSFMNSSYASEDEKLAYAFYVKAAGSEENAGEILGQAAYDVDEFKDTRLGEWWRPYERAPIGGLGGFIVQYTSYWHFLNMTRGEDAHGNDHGGYDYRYHTKDPRWWANIDTYAKYYLYNLQLHEKDFNSTEAHYRQGSHSTIGKHYEDFQNIAWQPIDNLAKYWYDQFILDPSLEMIGFTLHAVGDVAQPHHVWVSSSNSHAGWEGWIEDYYDEYQLSAHEKVSKIIGEYDTEWPVRDILTHTAGIAYEHPEVLYNRDTKTRVAASNILIPHAVASAVTVLTKGALYFYD
ncbi:MAG: hypothetical protein HON94_03260 [Methylococcales bacterium]|jgi:hypothetical protein|nr:hypothetical protein [Methylococcales bacterium]MBT7411145.1 hypothetical protein [Methylococcales bacterium]